MILWAIRDGNSLRPWGAESAHELGRVPFGKPVYVEVKQPRNSKFHRLYWVLVQRVAAAIGCEPEALSDYLKVKTGHVRAVQTKTGVHQFPASISFAKLDQISFKRFFEKVVTVIETDLGIARPDILEAIGDLLHEDHA